MLPGRRRIFCCGLKALETGVWKGSRPPRAAKYVNIRQINAKFVKLYGRKYFFQAK